MFWKRKAAVASPQSIAGIQSYQASMNASLDAPDRDPTDQAKLCAREISQCLMDTLKDERGVRIETALGVLGSLAGVSASFAMWHSLTNGRLRQELPEVMVVDMKSGGTFMFGDYINRRILEGERIGPHCLSIWHLAAGQALTLGGNTDLDIGELASRVAGQIGSEEFGQIDVPDLYHPGETPQAYAMALFPKFRPILARYGLDVADYFLPFGLAVQHTMTEGKAAIDPTLALRIVMECAVPASKIDPRPLMT